jgi:muconolactone D-isomerase
MLFLVRIDIDVPASVSVDRVKELTEAERQRAAELAAAGSLQRLWRDPTRWANWGLWDAPDEVALLATIGTLPLRPFMTLAVHPVTNHSSDPPSVMPSLPRTEGS